MAVPTLVELAESGAHFGHHKSLTFPKSKVFVYMIKNNVALINLEKTQEALIKAQEVFQTSIKDDKPVLFVGTRRAVRGITKEIAKSVDCHYITERWFGGMLTNFSTMKDSIKRMNELETFLAGDESKGITKKERLLQETKLARSKRFMGGVSKLKVMPELIILASASEDKIAVGEANQLGIPVISITDTDMNPEFITYPIPANDDAPKAVELILNTVISKPITKTKKTIAEKDVVKEEKSEKTVTKKASAVKPIVKKTVAKKTSAKKVVKNTVSKKPAVKKAVKLVVKKTAKKAKK